MKPNQAIRGKAMRGAAALAAGLTFLAAGAAQAAPWKAEQTQTGVQYRIGNEIRNSFVIHCPNPATVSAGTWIDMTLFGERLPRRQTIQIDVGASIFRLDVDESGRIGTASEKADKAFELFWAALREGSRMTVRYPNGLAGTFTLRGTTQSMPARACQTDFDRL